VAFSGVKVYSGEKQGLLSNGRSQQFKSVIAREFREMRICVTSLPLLLKKMMIGILVIVLSVSTDANIPKITDLDFPV